MNAPFQHYPYKVGDFFLDRHGHPAVVEDADEKCIYGTSLVDGGGWTNDRTRPQVVPLSQEAAFWLRDKLRREK